MINDIDMNNENEIEKASKKFDDSKYYICFTVNDSLDIIQIISNGERIKKSLKECNIFIVIDQEEYVSDNLNSAITIVENLCNEKQLAMKLLYVNTELKYIDTTTKMTIFVNLLPNDSVNEEMATDNRSMMDQRFDN